MIASFAVLLSTIGCVDCSRICVDVSGLPEKSRFVGTLLTERVQERTLASDAKGALSVRYVLDAAVEGENAEVRVKGEKGDWLYCMRGAAKVTPSDPDTPSSGSKMKPLMASKNKLLEPIAGSKAVPGSNHEPHFSEWLKAIKAGDPSLTVTNAEIAQRSSSACCLGRMCMELSRGKKDGASLKWCPKKETTCCEEAKWMLKPFARGEYDLAKTLKRFGKDISSILTA